MVVLSVKVNIMLMVVVVVRRPELETHIEIGQTVMVWWRMFYIGSLYVWAVLLEVIEGISIVC